MNTDNPSKLIVNWCAAKRSCPGVRTYENILEWSSYATVPSPHRVLWVCVIVIPCCRYAHSLQCGIICSHHAKYTCRRHIIIKDNKSYIVTLSSTLKPISMYRKIKREKSSKWRYGTISGWENLNPTCPAASI